jgi:signal transduction histidine kinase
MEKLLDALLLGRAKFHELPMTGRVVLSQLPLNITLLLVLLIVLMVDAPVAATAGFLWGQAAAAALLLACLAVPWGRLPYGSFLVIPLLDFIPVGILRPSAGDTLGGLGLLAVFPVMWIAGSGLWPKAGLAAGAAATLAVVWWPLFSTGAPSPQQLVSQLLVPIMMFAIGVAVSVMTRSGMAQQRQVEDLLARSELRQEMLDTVLDAVDVGVVVIDADGNDLLMNRRQRELHAAALPYGTQDAPEQRLIVLDPETGALVDPERRPARRAIDGETFSHEVYILGEGPDSRTVSASARPLRGPQGSRAGSVLVFSDITEILEAVKAKDSFLGSMSHEFRTPLTSIRGYAELLMDDDGLPAYARADLQIMERNARHLQQMVDDVLAAATGTAAQTLRSPLDLAELAAHAAQSAERDAASRSIRLVADAGGPLPVMGDRTAVVRVLDNLISNALKYSGSGATVTVTARDEDGMAVAEVADEGIGMSEEDVSKAFVRFHRSDAARRSGIPGVGLGLALAHDVAREHGGTLECRSVLGEGSVFTLRLPLSVAA